ncbi:AraC family transcriptional regulator [Paenibacillus qinlingensis]|uniref:Iron complex transport system substrate-binding protein n=1 Tax=Paenibacillus qinlingensis TaxID=1837343 RepID=A0ABU1NWT7_9BACL|nr:AraC family transcriptional regulator [Paenibacillus qinlingensis]MDR6551764.1 iron complex transport system substrate-binding protein [Paenibacillus qinlingensis]
MIVENHLILWNQALLKIIDVQRSERPISEYLQTSKLASSAILYIVKGRARLLLDGNEHHVENGYVCHAGKGTVLTITDITDSFEYYLIMYKASLPLPCSQDLIQLLARTKPFDSQYACVVSHAAPLLNTLSRMEQEWEQPEAMGRLQVKSLFYQLICELMGQLQHQQMEQDSPDMVLQAVRYIDEHYAEPITADTLAMLFNSSSRTMQRMFNKRLGLGPIDYLMQIRIDKAKELLSGTKAGLKDISEAVGYLDNYYFSRLFKRYTGVSPSMYRESMQQALTVSSPMHAPFHRSQPTIIHLKGELILQRQPEKIALLDPQFLDHFLALGEQPAGSVMDPDDLSNFPEYLFGKPREVTVLGTMHGPDLEALRSLAPDLIICTEIQSHIFASLTQIAPTVMLKRNRDWRETLRTIGRILGKKLEAEQVIQLYKNKINGLKSQLAAKMSGQSVTLIRPLDNAIRLHTCAHRTAAILYTDLGLNPPKQAIDRKRTSSLISLEGLPEVDADHYFVLTNNHYKSWSDELQTTTTWRGLRAVKQHHIYHAKSSIWIAYYGPIAMNHVVDSVAKAFLDAK